MTNLEKKLDAIIDLLLADDDESRENAKSCLVELRRSEQECTPSSSVERVIEDILTELGVPCALLGYRYITIAVQAMVHDPDAHRPLVKDIYPSVANIVGGECTAIQVERSIRHAVTATWRRSTYALLHSYFGGSKQPTNGEFLGRVALEARRRIY